MACVFETVGRIRAGQLLLKRRPSMAQAFTTWPDQEVVVTVEAVRALRPNNLNTLYWVGYVDPLCEHTGYERHEIHAYLKQKFLPRVPIRVTTSTGEVVDEAGLEPSTAMLTPREFGDYLRAIGIWAQERLGLRLGQR